MEEAPAKFKNLGCREYQGHKKKVHSVAWNCTGTKLASGSVDHTAHIWNIDAHGHVIPPFRPVYDCFNAAVLGLDFGAELKLDYLNLEMTISVFGF
ncbi:hypothetical protein KSP40_PGU005809 [Platanthera guangdongensis]|uniref:Uncharacterized protein n=1 Tax=Platanthera guangdongensis TaxID=2320717 RepID=A0ABR2MGU1_9ASPA